MKKVKVRCWKISSVPGEELFITYPEGHMGHELIICLKCGQVYAAEVSVQLYVKPLEEQLKQYYCVKCGDITSLFKYDARVEGCT